MILHENVFNYSFLTSGPTADDLVKATLFPIMDRKKFTAMSAEDYSDGEIDVLANRVAEIIEEKMKLIDTRDIDDSLGDIKRLSNYRSLSLAIDILKQGDLERADSVLEAIMMLHNLIRQNKVLFVKAYKESLHLGKWFYRSLVIDLIRAIAEYVSQVVTVTIDAGKVIYSINSRALDHTSDVFKRVFKQVNALKNGHYEKIQKKAMIKKEIRDSDLINLEEGDVPSESFVIVNDGAAALTIAVIAGSIALLLLIREAITVYYKMRRSLVKELDIISTFLKVNAASKKGLDPKVRERQKKLAEKFDSLARVIRVDSTQANKEASLEVNNENRKLKNHARDPKVLEEEMWSRPANVGNMLV